jgi:hypothetical protein
MFTLLLLLAQAPTSAHESAIEVPVPAPRMTVYGSPASTVIAGVMAPFGPGGAYLPTGFTMLLGPSWGLSAELAGGLIFAPGAYDAGWSAMASFGPTFFPLSDGLEGLFVTLKAIVQAREVPRFPQVARPCFITAPCPVPAPSSAQAAMVGGDIGYQWRRARLTVALLLGLSFGWGNHQSDAFTYPLDPTTAQRSGLALGLNLNFLRVGYAF